MRVLLALPVLVFVGVLSGCSLTSAPDTTVTGTVATAPAPLAEAFIGDAAGRMDDFARRDYLAAQSYALDSGDRQEFKNETMGAQGTIKVGPSTLAAADPSVECRTYSSVLWVLGNGQLVEGEACREGSGPWKAMGYFAH